MYFLILFRYKDTIGKLDNVLITSVFRYYMNYFLFLIDDRPESYIMLLLHQLLYFIR